MNGVIVEVKNNKAVLLTKNGEFVKISNKNYRLGESINYKQTIPYRGMTTIAACLALFIFTFNIMFFTPTSYASIDINPSIQLEINRFNKVIGAYGLNEDGKKLTESVNLKYKNVDESINKIVEVAGEMGYITEVNKDIVIDVVDGDNLITKIADNTKKYNDGNVNIVVEKASKDELKLSNELGVSVGRAKAIKEYSENFGGDVKENKEKLSEVSVGELKKSINSQNKENQNVNTPKDESPKQTQKPVVTEEPKKTEKPEKTVKPEKTDKPVVKMEKAEGTENSEKNEKNESKVQKEETLDKKVDKTPKIKDEKINDNKENKKESKNKNDVKSNNKEKK